MGGELWAFFQRLDSKLGKPDLLHAHGYIGGFAAHYLSVLHDIPFILTEHGSNFISDKIHGWHRNKIKKTYKEALALIAVGENLKEAMTKFTDNRILVIPNLVNEVVFNPATTKSQDRFEFLSRRWTYSTKKSGRNYTISFKSFYHHLQQNHQ